MFSTKKKEIKMEETEYEYLADNDGQLLVVQEDGTFLCFNRPIQYVQEDDVKNVLEGVQGDVYDESSQQLYEDEENSSEMILSDQFEMSDGQKNVYENNYLLQDSEASADVPMEEDVQYKEVTVNEETVADGESGENKTSGDCTEITLNDEQYQLLEQKGWILLECSDKTYLLDSSGLHDITDDEKLILKLKLELQADEEEEIVSSTVKGVKKEYVEIKIEPHSADMMNCVTEHEGIETEGEEQEAEHTNNTAKDQGTLSTIEETVEEATNEADITPIEAEHDYVKLSSVKDSRAKRQNDSIRIKTKFSFRDIPPEIVLGKFNGKKLVARVTKTQRLVKRLGTNININNTEPNVDPSDFPGLPDSKFERLICEAVRGRIDCSVTDVTAAEIVVVQLSRVAAFRTALMERGLIITKVIVHELESGELYSESTPSLVTGRAVRDNVNNCHFRYMPEMLWKLSMANEFENEVGNKTDFLHIHIRENKATDGIIRISITLNKRNIPLHLFRDIEVSEEDEIYTCGSCDSIFDTAESLQLHLETECAATDNEAIDMEEAKNAYRIINTTRGKQYACNICNIVYSNLLSCQEHIQSHFTEDEEPEAREPSPVQFIRTNDLIKKPSQFIRTETKKPAPIQIVRTDETKKPSIVQIVRTDESKKPMGLYKCTMCNRAFFDLPSLSKHIVTRHIKQVHSP
ncbi:uncharacterized protein LOC112053424 [Bicyclus anynana]|uniref:Uncharacterized protein LOC112053424 n=1 Tax=Bicyclus anynana TaxID=110368 RepID=A0A6J1NTV7_BICAN|nr:uncharacterized protein LOC112053424 [Bicyclus anynana]